MCSELRNRILLGEKPLTKRSVIFCDRDGVLIEDKHYLCDPEEVTLCRGVQSFFDYIKKIDIKLVIITNQSGIERGYYSWKQYKTVTNRMLMMLHQRSSILGIYANGSKSIEEKGSWRKPGIGMIAAAARDFNINIEESILIGDRLTDMQAGENAGIKKLIHVLSGKGEDEKSSIIKWHSNRKKIRLRTLDSIGDFQIE